jgi:hypothetical protein
MGVAAADTAAEADMEEAVAAAAVGAIEQVYRDKR